MRLSLERVAGPMHRLLARPPSPTQDPAAEGSGHGATAAAASEAARVNATLKAIGRSERHLLRSRMRSRGGRAARMLLPMRTLSVVGRPALLVGGGGGGGAD